MEKEPKTEKHKSEQEKEPSREFSNKDLKSLNAIAESIRSESENEK